MVKRKGAGYMIEAIIASLTIFVFIGGGLQVGQGQDWSEYGNQIGANDLTYVLKNTGKLRKYSEENQVAGIQPVATGITGGKLQVQGEIQGLPIGDKEIGFHVPVSDIRAEPGSPHSCSTMPLDSVSDSEVLETDQGPANVRLMIADTDPDITGGTNGETDYDSVYVDNGSECQFSASEGPYYRDEITYWGEGNTGSFYDIKNISDGEGNLLLYNADQPKVIGDRVQEEINGIDTDVSVDTFNFSDNFTAYDTLVFRSSGPGYTVDRIDENSDRVLSYLEDGSVLFLMDLKQRQFDSSDPEYFDFINRTGLRWIDLNWTSKPSEIRFPDTEKGRRVSAFYRSLEDSEEIGLAPGGNTSSGTSSLGIANLARYNSNPWNATNFSMGSVSSIPEAPDDSCNYFRGNFTFPEKEKRVGVNMTLGCSTSDHTTGVRIDLNGDLDTTDDGEGVFINGGGMKIGGRKYRVKTYDRGVEFVYTGPDEIEFINYRTGFPESRSIQEFARMPYRDSYSDRQLSLVASVIHWISGTSERFGSGEPTGLSTTAIGSVNSEAYMPYRARLRWYQ